MSEARCPVKADGESRKARLKTAHQIKTQNEARISGPVWNTKTTTPPKRPNRAERSSGRPARSGEVEVEASCKLDIRATFHLPDSLERRVGEQRLRHRVQLHAF